LDRIYSPTGPMIIPQKNGTRHPQDSRESWDKKVEAKPED
jgi:hypothetical protein